jgi:DNA invertase Pin-like site-specific DNA recombinase
MLRVACYHRVSTLDQDETLAHDELELAAKRLGATAVTFVEETGSGAKNDRAGLQALLRDVDRGKFDCVIVWKLDRFGRSAHDLLTNIRRLETAGCRFIASTQGLDIRQGGDSISKLILTVLAAVAEYELSLISSRTRLGIAAARSRGVAHGRPQTDRPEKAKVNRLRKKGYSWPQVAKALGFPVWAVRDVVEPRRELQAAPAPRRRRSRAA